MIMIFYMVMFIILFILLIVMIIMSIRNKHKTNETATNSIDKSVADILPIRDYDELHECYVLEDNTYMDLLQIKSKDLNNASEDEILYDKLRYSKLYKKYVDDLKIIAINMLSNTDKQLEYIRYKIAHTKNKVFKEELRAKEKELLWLAQNRSTREYYYMYWGDSVEALLKNRNTILGILQSKQDSLIHEVSKKKKDDVLRKMNNKSMLCARR